MGMNHLWRRKNGSKPISWEVLGGRTAIISRKSLYLETMAPITSAGTTTTAASPNLRRQESSWVRRSLNPNPISLCHSWDHQSLASSFTPTTLLSGFYHSHSIPTSFHVLNASCSALLASSGSGQAHTSYLNMLQHSVIYELGSSNDSARNLDTKGGKHSGAWSIGTDSGWGCMMSCFNTEAC